VFEDLCADKRSKYAALSMSEFELFLRAEYRQQAKLHAERQAQAMAKEREEYERRVLAHEDRVRRARAEFDALGKEMAKATTRAELVDLERKRADLAQLTGDSYKYETVCWGCGGRISSGINARCRDCGWYICSNCDACGCGYHKYHGYRKSYGYHVEADDPFLPNYPNDLS
jgi:hypothetical protein